MEQTLILKGVGILSTLIGVYQWVVVDASPTDIFFLLLITAFLLAIENDFAKHRGRAHEEEAQNGEHGHLSPSEENDLPKKHEVSDESIHYPRHNPAIALVAGLGVIFFDWSSFITF